MRNAVWAFFAWLFLAHAAPAPAMETLQYIPFNFQNDTRQLKTPAELQTECAIWEGMVAQGSYGTHQLTCHVWPYVTIPYDKPTNPDGSQCTTAMGFAADTAARQAGYAIGSGSATNYLFYRAPMDNNGGDVCSHRNAWTGMYGVTLFQYAEAELWLSTVKGRHCCSWTKIFSNAARTSFVTLRDSPNPSIDLHTDQRNYFLWTGQGHGSWTAMERLSFGYLTDAQFFHVNGPPTGQSQTYTLMPMDDGLTDLVSKRAIEFNEMGLLCEARKKPETIDLPEGLVCFETQTYMMVDMPPLPPWQGGSWPGMTSLNWALGVGQSYTDPTNNQRITLTALSSTGATIRLDHGNDASLCTPTPEGQVVTALTESACGVWTLGPQNPDWPVGNFNLLRDGTWMAKGVGRSYESCASTVYTFGADAVWYRWNGSGWDRLTAIQPCGPPPPPPTWHVYGGSQQLQQLDADANQFRVCWSDGTHCSDPFVWIH